MRKNFVAENPWPFLKVVTREGEELERKVAELREKLAVIGEADIFKLKARLHAFELDLENMEEKLENAWA